MEKLTSCLSAGVTLKSHASAEGDRQTTLTFFVFADRHDHAWRKRLDPEDFDLGSGDRALVKGGKIHPRYRIMVPEEFVGKELGHGA